MGVSGSKRAFGLIGVVLGALLLGIDGRWVGGEEMRAFVVRIFGGELWSLEPGAFFAAATLYAPGLGAGAWDLSSGWVLAGWVHLVLALAVGAQVGPRLLRAMDVEHSPSKHGAQVGSSFGRVGSALGCGLVLLLATSPWLLSFVAQRSVQSGAGYLGLTDLARGGGIGLLWVGVGMLWPRGEASNARANTAPSIMESKLSPWLAALVAMAVPVILSAHFLDGEPLTNDGVAYQFQAELFASGELQRDVQGLEQFFPARQILPGNLATSKYPPGHSLVLAPGFVLGIKRLMPVLLAGLTVFLTWLLARRLGSASPGAVTWFVALSPMFLGVETLWLSHGTSIPMCMVFVYSWIVARDRSLPMSSSGEPQDAPSPVAPALLAGFALSIAFTARPLTALAFGLPCGVELLVASLRARTNELGEHGPKPRPWTAALAGAVGFLPGLLFFLIVNKAITGSATKPVYTLYAELLSPNDQWGLMNLGTAFSYTVYNLARLSSWLGGVGAGLGLLLLGWRHRGALRHSALVLSIPAALLALYSLHRFHGIPWAGPLYLVEAVPLFAMVAGTGLLVLARHLFGRAGTAAYLVALLVTSTSLLSSHLRAAEVEADLRAAPRLGAAAVLQEMPNGDQIQALFLIPMDAATARKRHPLLPPALRFEKGQTSLIPSQWPVFVRDLGQPNHKLWTLLGQPPTWRWSGEAMVPVDWESPHQ